MIHVTRFAPDGAVQIGGQELAAAPLAEGESIWIDLEGFKPEYEGFLRQFGYHPLAIEDTFTLEHQPKVEEYDGLLFVIVRGLDFGKKSKRLATLKLAAFVDRQRLVTSHRSPMRSVEALKKRLSETRRSLPGGPINLFYHLCDQVVDHYFPTVDTVAQEIEKLEEEIFELPRQEHLARLLDLRRSLASVRRVMLPHRQVFSHLASATTPLIDAQMSLYFRDIYDNVLRLADTLDQQRDFLASVKDTYLSVLGQRTNEIMKVLTLFSAVLLPLTFIAGVYGMNFEHMPELSSRFGYPAVLAAMAALAGGMFAWFRSKHWL